jgi:hypothetical protein
LLTNTVACLPLFITRLTQGPLLLTTFAKGSGAGFSAIHLTFRFGCSTVWRSLSTPIACTTFIALNSKKVMKKFTLSFLSIIFIGTSQVVAQEQEPPAEYAGGLKVSLSEDGQKYFRLIAWTQFWLDMRNTTNNPAGEERFTATPVVRRSRLLIYAQLSERFLILTHFGLNNLTPAGMDPLGYSPQAQLFLHDAWIEFKVTDNLYLGSGLHYWNGISRMNNQSTLNFLPLDNPRHAWANLGISDQFARHLGLYAKGKIGKLDYRIAWNGALVNNLDVQNGLAPRVDTAAYTGRSLFGSEATNIFAGYFNYQFLEQESNKLPYFVGSYLGKKRVFNIGAGFFAHPNGSAVAKPTDANPNIIEGENVFIWAVDAFAELPFGTNNASFTGYLQYQSNNYGSNYQLSIKNPDESLSFSQGIFTGNIIYFQGGVLLPYSGAVAWQPYVTLTQKGISALDGSATDFGIGINSLITGHHAKLSLEYRSTGLVDADARNRLILQAVVFL